MKNTIDTVADYIRSQKLLYWKLYYADSSNIVGAFPIESEGNESININSAVDKFKELTEFLPQGTYILKGRSKDADRNNDKQIPLIITNSNNNFSDKNNAVFGADSFEVIKSFQDKMLKMQSDFEQKMLQIQNNQKIAELERKLEEAENKKPDLFERLLEMAFPFFVAQLPLLKGFGLDKVKQKNPLEQIFSVFDNENGTAQGSENGTAQGSENGTAQGSENGTAQENFNFENEENLILQNSLQNLETALGDDFTVVLHTLGEVAKTNPEFIQNAVLQLRTMAVTNN